MNRFSKLDCAESFNTNENSTIPIIIYHEGNQDYLKTCIEHNLKFNKRIILIGDDTNKNFGAEWYDSKDIISSKWDEFEKVFENMSYYSDKFSLQICKRLFLINEFIEKNRIEEFILLDSDILAYINFSEYFHNSEFDAAFCIPYENENNYIWTANIGISYWNRKAINDLIEFYIHIYKYEKETLREKWEFHRQNKLPGGVSEMTICYLWAKHTQCKIANAAQKSKTGIFDYNLMSSENYLENEYVMDNILKIKKIKIIEEKPYFESKEGEYIKVLALHFLGPSKKYMKEFSEKSEIGPIGRIKALFNIILLGKLKTIYKYIKLRRV